jgi:hypothetical protein
MSSEDAEVRAPDETLVLDPEPREGTDPEPLVVSEDPEPEDPTGVVEGTGPPLLEEAIGEETLLTWLPFGTGIDTVRLLPLESTAQVLTGNWTNGSKGTWCGLNFAVAGEIRTERS